jgi:hypothetical protein
LVVVVEPTPATTSHNIVVRIIAQALDLVAGHQAIEDAW